MKQLSRVVWNEGMHLAQHHFQAQSRYFEDAIEFALSGLFFKPYGLAGCELDGAAVRNDVVSLVHARGVMPDGLPFDIPASDLAPKPLGIRELFSPTADSHLVILAIPSYRVDRANFTLNGEAGGATSTRYSAHPSLVLDDTTGRDERSVSVGRKNFRLVLDAEPLEDIIGLPIARVKRDGSGHFMYDPDFVPPALHIGASTRLMQLLQRLVDVLDAKSSALARGRPGSLDEFAQQEVASFWLLHAIHSTLPVLRHYLQAKRIHPERLYVEMTRLAGALCTFALDAHPRTLPAYDHDRPEGCFDILDRHIRANLDIVAPTGRTIVPLRATGPFLHTGTVADARCYGSAARWILGVRSPIGRVEVAARVPQLAKVCSSKFVLELVKRAYPGMRVEHLQFPPPSIAPRPDTTYFGIERAGPCWETITATHEIGVYMPDSVPQAEIEVIVIEQ